MRVRRSRDMRWVAALTATATAGSMAVLAATAAAAGTDSTNSTDGPTATVTGDLAHLTVTGAPGDEVVLPGALLVPTVDDMIAGIVGRVGETRDCATVTEEDQRSWGLCKTKTAFDSGAAVGRTVDLGSTVGDGDIEKGTVAAAAADRITSLANSHGIAEDETFPAKSGNATLTVIFEDALDAAGLADVTVTEPPTTTAPTTTTTTTTQTPPADPTTTDPGATNPAPPTDSSTEQPTTTTVAPPPPGNDPAGGSQHAPPAQAPGGGAADAPSAPSANAAFPDMAKLGGDAEPGTGNLLTPSDELLERLRDLVPDGEPVWASTAPDTSPQQARSGDHHRVELRTAGSARAIGAGSGDRQDWLAAVLGALLGLTLVGVGLVRAWVVRRSR